MALDGIALTVLGVAAGVLILTGWVHQIIKGYRTKSLRDVSRYLMIMIGIGAVLWLVYGLVVEDVYVVGTNVAAVVLMSVIFVMKQRYDRMRDAP